MEVRPNKIAIMCMDARMNRIADSINDGRTIFVRTAAANPPGAINTLNSLTEKNSISSIFYMPHNDCGACKFTHAIMSKGEGSTQEIEKGLISTIRSYSKNNYSNICRSPDDLSIKLQELGINFIQHHYPTMAVSSRMADTSYQVTGEKRMILSRPSSMKYSEMCSQLELPYDSTYVSQHTNLIESLCDIQLSSSALHITNFTVAIIDDSERQKIEDEVAVIRDALKHVPQIDISIEEVNTTAEREKIR